MDENEDPSVAIPANGDPSFFLFAVLFVKDGYGQWIQKQVGSTLETDPVFTQVFLRLDGVPLEIVAQRSPTVLVYDTVIPGGPTQRILSPPIAVVEARGAAKSFRPQPATIQYVRVNHRRPDVLVPQELLYGADVVTVLQKMGGKGMAKRVVVTCLANPACRAASWTAF